MILNMWNKPKPSETELIRRKFRRLMRDPERRKMVTKAINNNSDITVLDDDGKRIKIVVISNHINVSYRR